MRISDISRLAWDQVRRRKVVTGLCMAGISIGCAAIIVALSLGESAQSYSEKTMNQYLKMDEITVMPNSGMPSHGANGGGGAGEGNEMLDPGKLTRQKLEIIQGLNHVEAATPFQEIGYMQMYTIDNRKAYVQVIGTDLRLLEKYDKTFKQGGGSHLPGMAVLNYGATLGLIDDETQKKMNDAFANDPFNFELREQYERLNMLPSEMYQQQIQLQMQMEYSTLNSSPLRVNGILNKASGSNDQMESWNKIIYVSLETAERLAEELNLNNGASGQAGVYNSVIVKVDSTDNIVQLEQLIQKLTLNTSTNLYQQEMLAEQFDMVKKAALGVGVFILIIASISIIVAMTMSTHQRRRQIGIMKVLGANMGQIRNMFITEAALLGLLGGILGVLISYLIVFGINQLIGTSAGPDPSAGIIIFIPIMTLPVGISFAIMTGVLSGIYPAISASRTDALTAIKRD
ncbi:ABC transporter permease [Paenibacillus sp. FA6]|uniref:ABC transporter permease n=1 Tax=Paenibacillus sp. FA6 TaxID=3413029 RepID=UPI003F65EB15